MRRIRRDILASLALALWVAAWIAPIHHRVEHARENQLRSLRDHIGHVHGGVEALDSVPASVPHDLACVLCTTTVATEANTAVKAALDEEGARIGWTPIPSFTNHFSESLQIRGPPFV